MFSSGEYTNARASPYTEYTTLNHYYKHNRPRPPLHAGAPSEAFPVLLEQGNIWGYDTLTHDVNDTNGYYTADQAYGDSCHQPSYYVAKCPSNQFIRPFLKKHHVSSTAIPHTATPIHEGYSDLHNKLKDLNVVLIVMDGCHFCHKHLQLLKDAGAENLVQVVKHNDPNWAHLAKKARGFPAYFSLAKGTSGVGYPGSLEQMIANLA